MRNIGSGIAFLVFPWEVVFPLLMLVQKVGRGKFWLANTTCHTQRNLWSTWKLPKKNYIYPFKWSRYHPMVQKFYCERYLSIQSMLGKKEKNTNISIFSTTPTYLKQTFVFFLLLFFSLNLSLREVFPYVESSWRSSNTAYNNNGVLVSAKTYPSIRGYYHEQAILHHKTRPLVSCIIHVL